MAELSWNEIQSRAIEFVSLWENETYEKGESQSFWSDFLSIFGVNRKRHGAFFEYAVKKVDNKSGFIDLFWPGKLLAEQKSGGRSLDDASTQALEYLHGLPDADLPEYIVVSDFGTFELLNLETREHTKFSIHDLPKNIKQFAFLINRASITAVEENPVNRKAAETMARLHNQLHESNYRGHALELLLVRLVFCLFADDAGIFERGQFENYLKFRTSEDGSDLGSKLSKIFEVLNTEPGSRQTTLDEDLASYPYVNGGLFKESTMMPDFSGTMRKELLEAAVLDWSQVSPAIFGSMFQGVMDEETRRNLGAHYTSERNIMKVIKPLFLDELYSEYDLIKHNKKKLQEFHQKIGKLTFMDPACGCGNFLVITYRELRKLEHLVLSALHGQQTMLTDVTQSIRINVDQMFGIEIEEFPALIAETALWLTDHQMNMLASKQFGHVYLRLPLRERAKIVNTDALEADWEEIIPVEDLNYILGNPPFVGSKYMTDGQRAQVVGLYEGVRGSGTIDFVSAWYRKAATYMAKNTQINAALVSTNSISQGEQVSVIWSTLLNEGVCINFAHQTFKWSNEGKGVAGVYCVIIGFSYSDAKRKRLFVYDDVKADPHELIAKNINPYLVDAPNVLVSSRSRPISDVPEIGIGNKPIDGGFYLFTEDEKEEFIRKEPGASPYFKKWVGSHEFINRYYRWVLWLGDARPSDLRQLPLVLQRIREVQQFRLSSNSPGTRALASKPTRFHVENMPKSNFLLIPEVSSEKREYIPIGFMPPDEMASNLVKIVPNASLYDFGVLTSRMHMAWVRSVCGRLESRYRYSKDIVYNNFPWPNKVKEAERETIERLAQQILEIREQYPDSSLADLYDPLTMPPSLHKAHKSLDKNIDVLYRKGGFEEDTERVAWLFRMYAKQTSAPTAVKL